MIDDKFIDELKEKNNLVDVASKYCDLKRKGAVNYWACCPLPGHSEKTPSFTVNEPGQFFKCFGCGRGGDVISFIRIMENLDYVGAVRFLAERAGLPMPDDNRDYAKIAKERSERDRLLALMKTTAMFYVENLKDPRAKKYIDYMQSREVDMRTMKIFGIGASLDMFSLPRHLKAKGFTEEEMIKCCVCKRKEKEDGSSFLYDFLAERLVFPIINNLGNVIAFGGRTLEKNPRFMKYKNTEETELFKKNRTLFNLNKLKLERAKQELTEVILVEGYMGTIRPYINGFKNVVASMGTSLTVEQAKILKRYAPTVIICYDGDSAGQKSTLRGLDILAGQGLEVKVLQLPPPDDPDDFIRKHGAEEFKKLLDESLPLIDYKLKILEKGYDITNDAERRKYIQEAIKVISAVSSESEREELLRKLGLRTKTTYESLKRDSERAGSAAADKPTDKEITESAAEAGDVVNTAERFILCAKLFGKPYAKGNDIYSANMNDPVHNKLLDVIAEYEESGKEIFPANVSEVFGENELAEYNAVLSSGDFIFGTDGEEKYYKDCLFTIRKNELNNELTRLNALAAKETDTVKRAEILKAITEVMAKLNGGQG